jgi:hypothetical protein
MTGMTDGTIPEHVTRFYGNCDFALDVIENGHLAFVHASILNDPFDPYGFLETDFGESYASLLYHVQRNHPADLPWFSASVTRQSWSDTVTALNEHLARFRSTTFVLCTCAKTPDARPENNLYMWAHYANGHRGVAVEFDPKALADAVLSHNAAVSGVTVSPRDAWTQMEYADVFPPITAEQIFQFMKQEMEIASGARSVRSDMQLDEYYKRMGMVKSTVWRVESEWRLMWRNDEIKKLVYKCPIGAEAITKIFLGLSIPPNVRERVITSARLQFPAVTILQARKRHGEFALRFERP